MLVFFIIMLGFFDMIFTVCHWNHGAQELNPVMRILLEWGTIYFVLVKSVITVVCTLFLSRFLYKRYVRVALHGIAICYAAIDINHLIMFYKHY